MNRLTNGSGFRSIRSCGLFLLIAFLLILLCEPDASATDFTSVQSGMYNDKTFIHETYHFTPFDREYVTVDFSHLHPGSYCLVTDWKTPWGSLEHQSSHTFVIQKPTPSYRVFSWLHLWKNGPFKRMVSGEGFKKEFYGDWEVIMYLNGAEVVRHKFDVQ